MVGVFVVGGLALCGVGNSGVRCVCTTVVLRDTRGRVGRRGIGDVVRTTKVRTRSTEVGTLVTTLRSISVSRTVRAATVTTTTPTTTPMTNRRTRRRRRRRRRRRTSTRRTTTKLNTLFK